MNSTNTLLGCFRGVVFMYVTRLSKKPCRCAAVRHSFNISQGITIETLALSVEICFACLKKSLQSRLSLCLASARDVLSHLRLLIK